MNSFLIFIVMLPSLASAALWIPENPFEGLPVPQYLENAPDNLRVELKEEWTENQKQNLREALAIALEIRPVHQRGRDDRSYMTVITFEHGPQLDYRYDLQPLINYVLLVRRRGGLSGVKSHTFTVPPDIEWEMLAAFVEGKLPAKELPYRPDAIQKFSDRICDMWLSVWD